jgi:hypothetical protein
MSSTITTIPRVAVTRYLRLLRLPVDAAGSIAHRDEAWAPALAFDSFEAQVLGLLGSVLHDDVLVQESNRQKARVEQLRRAATLEAAAVARRARADEKLDQRRDEAKEKVEEAQERKEREKARLEKAKDTAERKARQDASAKAQKAKKASDARQKRLADREREAEANRLEAERVALAEKGEALEASGAALQLDKAASAVKQSRKRQS